VASSVKQSSITGSFVSSNKHSSSVSNPKQLIQTLQSLEFNEQSRGRNNMTAESQGSYDDIQVAKASFHTN